MDTDELGRLLPREHQTLRGPVVVRTARPGDLAAVERMHHRCSTDTVFRRYFDSVYSLTVIFRDHGIGTSASIGLRYLRKEFAWMLTRHPLRLPYYALYIIAKASGTTAGHFAEKMPDWLLRRLSLHSYHWRRKSAATPAACQANGKP